MANKMLKANRNRARNASTPLCHLPGTFFKDLQTNFPETFHASSGIHRSCFTLAVFTKNRPIRALPQHMPATSVGTISKGLVSPYVTFRFAARARDHRLRPHPGPLGPSTPWPLFSPIVTLGFTALARDQRSGLPFGDGLPAALPHVAALAFPRADSPPPRLKPQAAGLGSPEFRRFDFSTFSPKNANHPNPRPPQVLAHFRRPVCHYMSPSILHDLRVPGARPSARARRIHECPRAQPPSNILTF